MVPAVGRYSPAINLSSVLLPAPLGATSPVRPAPTVNVKSVNSGVSSGQEKDRFEQTMEDMRHLSSRAGVPRLARGRTTGRSGHPEMSSPSMSSAHLVS